MPDSARYAMPLDTAIAFTEAWTSGKLSTARLYVDDDVKFEGPMATLQGADAYISSLKKLAAIVTGFDILAAYGDEEQAMLMYELQTKPVPRMTCAKLLKFHNGLIASDLLTFDPRKMIEAMEKQKPH